MIRVLGALAALLWVAGIVVLVVAYRDRSPGIEGVYYTRDVGAAAAQGPYSPGHSGLELVVGIVLVGVAGVLTTGLVLTGRRRLS